MSEEKKNLSLEDLEEVAGGVVIYEKANTKANARMNDKMNDKILIRDLHGREFEAAGSLESVQSFLKEKGIEVYSVAEAAAAGVLKTKSPMDKNRFL